MAANYDGEDRASLSVESEFDFNSDTTLDDQPTVVTQIDSDDQEPERQAQPLTPSNWLHRRATAPGAPLPQPRPQDNHTYSIMSDTSGRVARDMWRHWSQRVNLATGTTDILRDA